MPETSIVVTSPKVKTVNRGYVTLDAHNTSLHLVFTTVREFQEFAAAIHEAAQAQERNK